jgi:hypothetical protein
VNCLPRIALMLTAMIALAIGLAYAQPAWMKEMGIDYWNLPELRALIHQHKELSTKLDEKRLIVLEVNEQKDVVVDKVIQRKMTLAEAVRRIQDVSGPEYLEEACRILEIDHSTREDRFQSLVRFWIEKRLSDDPATYRQVLIRLDMEMHRHGHKDKGVKI